MTERKTSDILIRIEKNGYGDNLDLRIFHDGFEVIYPTEKSFLDELDLYVKRKLTKIKES